jgi:hypothetical protein
MLAGGEQTAEYTLLADRRHTCFDPGGQHGLLGQVQVRTADDAAPAPVNCHPGPGFHIPWETRCSG